MAISEARIELPTIAARGRSAVAVTFVPLGLTYGIWYSYSVFLVAVLRDFGWSRSVLAGAFSLFVMVHGLSGPVLGWLVERFDSPASSASCMPPTPSAAPWACGRRGTSST